MKLIYKYILIGLSTVLLLIGIYFTIELDFLTTISPSHRVSDGFGNEKNPETGKTYWRFPYLKHRAVQNITFWGGIAIITYAVKIESKKND